MIKITDLDPKSPVAESYRTIRTNLSFANIDKELKTILFTSAQQNEGKSTITSNIAYSFSKLENKKVLIMDLDLRNPSIHRIFERSNTYGIMDILKDNKELDKCIHKIDANLHILPVGTIPPNPTEVLSSEKMREFVTNIKEEYDFVFVDAPPAGVVSDAVIISAYVDGVMFVIGANETDISYAEIAIDNLRKAEANILGSVLNKFEANDSPYGYYSYYGYYYGAQSGQGRMAKKAKKSGFMKKLSFGR